MKKSTAVQKATKPVVLDPTKPVDCARAYLSSMRGYGPHFWRGKFYKWTNEDRIGAYWGEVSVEDIRRDVFDFIEHSGITPTLKQLQEIVAALKLVAPTTLDGGICAKRLNESISEAVARETNRSDW
ncbi:MAG: hypothetical protein HY661_03770 [Betaproteobacteria bacterium]|nr:hypothetical protein [Betaproteobacteria bacterium]